ncbi:MAG TPA: hypothetical protein VMU40_08720 [Steroidobacteraceae bacterium]|nr:hypothetical protein [Steroidobacteraceae bacterium]
MSDDRYDRYRPAAHVRAALLVVLVCAGIPLASSRAVEPLRSLLGCRRISDAVARLACFDRESAALAAASHGIPPSPGASIPRAAAAPLASNAAPSQPALDPASTFGFSKGRILAQEVEVGRRPPELAHITGRITHLATAANGRVLFTLANGEVWQELVDSGELLARVDDVVTISRGVFDSYYLRLPSGRGCKVTRLR